ncbi:tetratricopeptide repeat protein, partial [Cardiobacterium hominis]
MRLIPLITLTLFSSIAVAQNVPPAPVRDTATPDEKLPDTAERAAADKNQARQQNAQVLQVTEAELLADPPLLANALDSAIINGDADAVAMLLPIYRKLPADKQDKMLLRFGEAMKARADGDLSRAIARLREMIAEDPSLQPVRLHLAMALLADHQDEAARTQLEKLRSDELPEDIRNIVSQALDTLRERQSWTFNASGYYRHDKNINDAPR